MKIPMMTKAGDVFSCPGCGQAFREIDLRNGQIPERWLISAPAVPRVHVANAQDCMRRVLEHQGT